MSEISCLIWDVGNVLVKYFSRYVCLRLARHSAKSLEGVRAKIFGEVEWGPETPSYQFDFGLLNTDEFITTVRKVLGIDPVPLGLSDESLRRAFDNCFEFDRNIRRLLWFLSDREKCRRPMIQGVLSNNNELQWGFTLRTFPTLELKLEGGTMDFHVVSFREKMVKPMQGIYGTAFVAAWRAHYAETRHGLKPSECLFIDDRPENVEAAEEFGMKAELVESYGYLALAKILDRYGIPLPPDDYVSRPEREYFQKKSEKS